ASLVFTSRGYRAPSSHGSLASSPHASTGDGIVFVRSFGTKARSGIIVYPRQLSLLSVSRNEPLNLLPPDLVTTLTTPPLKRPNSAEMPAVATVVSWTASSIYR